MKSNKTINFIGLRKPASFIAKVVPKKEKYLHGFYEYDIIEK